MFAINLRKSLTTPNLPAASPSTGNLIREFLMRTRVPEILKPNPKSIISLASIEQQNEINLAYKHPLVVEEELVDDFGTTPNAHNKYCDAPQISIDNSSIIVAKTRKILASDNHDRPRLIGKINPNILKTWEQLSNNMEDDLQNRRVCNHESIGNQDEQEGQHSSVLFVRKPNTFPNPQDVEFNYDVRSSGDCERFYDSIDAFAVGGLSDEEITDFLPNAAGDGMANIDSLEMKSNSLKLWSIES